MRCIKLLYSEGVIIRAVHFMNMLNTSFINKSIKSEEAVDVGFGYARSVAGNGNTPRGRKKMLHAKRHLRGNILRYTVTGNSRYRIDTQVLYLLPDGICGKAPSKNCMAP